MDTDDTVPDLSGTDTTTPDPAEAARAEQEARGIIAERKRREAAEAELKRLRDADAERTRKEAEARGEWERLAKEREAENATLKAERDAHAAKLAAVEAREAEARAARVAKLTPEDREMLDGLTPEQIDARLPKLEARAAAQPRREADTDARSGGSGGDPDALTESQKGWWTNSGLAAAYPNAPNHLIRKLYTTQGPGRTKTA